MMTQKIVALSRNFALKAHADTNHMYDKHPYGFHLEMVVQFAEDYIYLISPDDRQFVIGGAWCHDTIEDCRKVYGDVKSATCKEVADLVYALSNEKGKNRSERANSKYYRGIRQTKHAVFLKLCDRLANVQYSLSKGKNDRMLLKYKEENNKFVFELLRPDTPFGKLHGAFYQLFYCKDKYMNYLINKSVYYNMFHKLFQIL